MPHLARSGFILRSPRRVSRKREFSWIWLETFGNSRPERSERQSPETIGDEKNPRVAGLSATKEGNSLKRGMPGWGGRIRTSAWGNQNPLPYHLATPQLTCPESGDNRTNSVWQRRSIERGELF